MTKQKIIIGSRASKLALWQANFVSQLLSKKGIDNEIRTWTTTGDKVQDRYLHEIGGKGLFTKELEQALLNHEADIAVHSLKDLPCRIDPAFKLSAILPRHASADVLIFRKDFYPKLQLKKHDVVTPDLLNSLGPMTIATSSLRRHSLLKSSCKEISIVPIRGNVDSRIQKLEESQWHGIILAEASLARLGLSYEGVHRFDQSWFVPCAGQGALAIETLHDSPIANQIEQLQCEQTKLACTIERSVLAQLGGDCTMPFGCHVLEDPRTPNTWLARAVILTPNGSEARATRSFSKDHVDLEKQLTKSLLQDLLRHGANEILNVIGLPSITLQD